MSKLTKTSKTPRKRIYYSSALAGVAAVFGGILLTTNASADVAKDVNVRVLVPTACSLLGTNTTLSADALPSQQTEIGTASFKAVCNDPSGLAIYAVGYTNDTYGNTNLVSTDGNNNTIATGAFSSPTNSQWNMTLANTGTDYPTTIRNGYESPSVIPSVFTKVASRDTITDQTTGANFTATFSTYVSHSQSTGVYNGKVKFLLFHPNVVDATTNPKTEVPNTIGDTMQYWTGCSSLADNATRQLEDLRDGNIYTVKKLNGQCWMIENLRFTGDTLNVGDSNVSETVRIAWGELDSGSNVANTDYNDYDNARLHVAKDNSGNVTNVWYNYAGASAMTITGSSNSTAATSSICPANWRLPTHSENGALVTALDANISAFSPVTGGRYYSGQLGYAEYGLWWSATASDSTDRYYLRYNSSTGVLDTSNGYRYYGSYVRCVRI